MGTGRNRASAGYAATDALWTPRLPVAAALAGRRALSGGLGLIHVKFRGWSAGRDLNLSAVLYEDLRMAPVLGDIADDGYDSAAKVGEVAYRAAVMCASYHVK